MSRHMNSQRGFTLAEILVAIAIFALIFIAALAMYDQSNQIFKRGVESAETQQNVRVSFDKMVADLRMVGFDFDRDGIPTGSTSAVWAPGRTYGVGNLVTPIVANGFVYRMTPNVGSPSSCVSGGGVPGWTTVVGNFTIDGTCRWQALQGLNQYQQPDEQIEFAHPSAVTVRANYDYELRMPGDTDNGREPALESSEFPVVTTGNDEIVTYALRSDNGPNNDTITFFADVDGRKSHGGAGRRPENLVRITRVNFGTTTGTFGGRTCTADDPCFPDAPYTLYRFTLDENGNPVETPLASNIRSMALKYYNNVTGVPAATAPAGWATTTRLTDAGGGQFNPDAPNANTAPRNARALIQSVRMTITGMTEAQERNYTNPLETQGPFRGYRTYRLESLIVPRNIGRQGMREIPPNPPGAPILQSVIYGYCGAVKVNWLAPISGAGQGQVESYAIMYNTTGSNTIFPFIRDAGPNTSGVVTSLDPTLNYTFTVAAVNSYGNQVAVIPGSTTTATLTVRPMNRTTPGVPPAPGIGSGSTVTGAPAAQPNQITVAFPSPTTAAAGALQITPAGTVPNPTEQLFGEITKYKVYRSIVPDFAPIDLPAVNANELKTNLTDPTYALTTVQIGSTTVTVVDKTAPNCVMFYYKFKAVEPCGETTASCPAACNTGGAAGVSTLFPPAGQPGIAAMSTTTSDPAAPSTLQILPTSVCAGPRCDINLSWPRVSTDVEDPPNRITVDKYLVTRTRFLNGAVDQDRSNPDGPAVQTFEVDDVTPLAGGDLTWSQTNIPSRQGGVDYEYVYSVQAMQCPDASTPPVYRMSAPSPEAKFPCTFMTTVPTVTVTLTLDGDGSTPASAWLTNNPASNVVVTPADPSMISSIQALLDNGSQTLDLGTISTPPYSFPLANTQIGELYELIVITRDTNGCARTVSKWVEEATQTGCCLAAFANDGSVVQYTPGTNFVDITLRNLCAQPLNLQNLGVQIVWDPVIAGNLTATTLTTVEFPSTGTGSAVLTVNDTATALSVAPRILRLNPPTATTPPGRTVVAAGSSNYVVRFNFNKILNSANPSGPIVKSCIIYQRPTIDTANQNCQIIPQPPAFNSCDF